MASKAKILKSIQHFDNVGKEIERFEERIRDAIAEPDCSAALIDVLKSKIEKYEKKLEETFSELNIDVGEEKWEKYLDMQDSLLNFSVSLEKVTYTLKKETGKENLENKNLVAKMPKLELPQFHGEMEYWITFKELFQATVIDNSDLTEIDKLQYLFASVKELWKQEEVPKTNAKIQIPDPCEESFSKSVKRNNEGRYIVNLPFKENNTLGESKEKAVQLLYALENKFHKNKQFKDNFLNFMNEYLALGHMREISQKRDDETPNCYIPYHMVINEKSTTTKCRVVFNASSKTKNGKSLNDVLMTGPKLQTEIFNHLIKFRSYRVAFAADIEKMYRQILISDEDCKYQRIVWRATPSDSLKSFELQTITYGTSYAPFLALRTLQHLYQDEEQNFPLAAKIARENIYIDDLLSGADTEVEAKSIIIEIQNLLKSGGFILRKWSSSHPKVLQDLDTSLLASKPIHSLGDEESKQRVLGLVWNLKTDSIQVKVVHEEIVKTKRQLLSSLRKSLIL
ncbi:integrase catalytic domain-containing protein [Trichonephila clavipes]|nr:integrase catalytic domain-containing protein [Trichonephila clavipes]